MEDFDGMNTSRTAVVVTRPSQAPGDAVATAPVPLSPGDGLLGKICAPPAGLDDPTDQPGTGQRGLLGVEAGARDRRRNRISPLLMLWLLTMTTSAAHADTPLFDFSTETRPGVWQIVNDDVMGGVSTSRFDLTDGVAVFRGEVSLDNYGGFASVRSLPARYDMQQDVDAFVIRVRGDGRRYKLTARMGRSFDGPVYQAAFATRPAEWEEHRLPFKDFVPTFRGRVLSGEPPLDATKIASVGFLIADKQAGPFRLEIAWIKAVTSPPP
jgi:monofunctional biosynthetic peptidoglycan transglycosylase